MNELKTTGNKTLEFYDRHTDDFISGTLEADMEETRTRFASYLPDHALILDFGCGSGRDTKAFLQAGYQVEAADGSEEICIKASEYTGIHVQRMLFSELCEINKYDGIWACASILHLPREELRGTLQKIETALKPGGVLYTSFKYGTFEGIRDGRYFTDFTEETLCAFWKEATSMQIAESWITEDVRSDRKGKQWINLISRRV